MTAATRSYRRRRGLPYAAALAAVFTVAGCTGEDPGPAVTTPPVSTSVTSTTTPATTLTTTAAPTSTGPTFPAGLPNAARAHNAKGAEAFVAYFMGQWNLSWTRPDSGLLKPLCNEQKAAACATVIKDAREYETKGWRFDGKPGTISNINALKLTGETQRVLAQIQQHKRNVVDSSGKAWETYEAKLIPLIFYLTWSRTGWELTDLRPVS